MHFIIHNSSSSLGNARLISHAHSSYWEIYNMKLSIDSYVVCIRSDLCRSYHTAIRGLQKKRDNFARNPTKKV